MIQFCGGEFIQFILTMLGKGNKLVDMQAS
jgi:hypothetical protein